MPTFRYDKNNYDRPIYQPLYRPERVSQSQDNVNDDWGIVQNDATPTIDRIDRMNNEASIAQILKDAQREDNYEYISQYDLDPSEENINDTRERLAKIISTRSAIRNSKRIGQAQKNRQLQLLDGEQFQLQSRLKAMAPAGKEEYNKDKERTKFDREKWEYEKEIGKEERNNKHALELMKTTSDAIGIPTISYQEALAQVSGKSSDNQDSAFSRFGGTLQNLMGMSNQSTNPATQRTRKELENINARIKEMEQAKQGSKLSELATPQQQVPPEQLSYEQYLNQLEAQSNREMGISGQPTEQQMINQQPAIDPSRQAIMAEAERQGSPPMNYMGDETGNVILDNAGNIIGYNQNGTISN